MATERALARLRETGARVTPQRLRVLAALLEAARPLAHHELEAALAPIDRVTLYRVLEWLAAQGIAHRVSGEDRVWRFGVADAAHAAHAHFECSRCSTVLCLGRRSPRTLPLPRGYRLQSVALTARGLCVDCA